MSKFLFGRLTFKVISINGFIVSIKNERLKIETTIYLKGFSIPTKIKKIAIYKRYHKGLNIAIKQTKGYNSKSAFYKDLNNELIADLCGVTLSSIYGKVPKEIYYKFK